MATCWRGLGAAVARGRFGYLISRDASPFPGLCRFASAAYSKGVMILVRTNKFHHCFGFHFKMRTCLEGFISG